MKRETLTHNSWASHFITTKWPGKDSYTSCDLEPIKDFLLGSCLPSFAVLLFLWERIYVKQGFYSTFDSGCID